MEVTDVPLGPRHLRSHDRVWCYKPRSDYNLVRWPWGDCKIWVNDPGNVPWGDDWVVLVWNIPSYDAAWDVLRSEASRGNCQLQ